MMKVAISAVRTKNIRLNRYELIESLKERGHTVFYIGQESEDSLHPDYDKYNVQFLSIPLNRTNTNPLKEIKSIIETKKTLQKNNIEALIVYGIRTFPTMVIAAKLSGISKILCVVNGSGRLFNLKGLKGFSVKFISYPMLWLSFMMSNSILFQNSDDLKMIKSKGLLWKKNYGIINGSGVNLDTYKSNYLQSESVFMMIGRLTGAKGINEYVQAAQRVKKIYPKTEFHIVGPMDNDDDSLNIDELNNAIADRIIQYTGKVDDVRPYIKQCRVFVLPSYHEGTPRTVLEAMAMGRAIITTNATGCRETVVEGINGFKVPIKDINSLTEKMIWMINHPDKVKEMGKESRKIAEAKYNVHNVNKIMLEKIDL